MQHAFCSDQPECSGIAKWEKKIIEHSKYKTFLKALKIFKNIGNPLYTNMEIDRDMLGECIRNCHDRQVL